MGTFGWYYRLTPLKQGVLEGGKVVYQIHIGDSALVEAKIVEKDYQENSIISPTI